MIIKKMVEMGKEKCILYFSYATIVYVYKVSFYTSSGFFIIFISKDVIGHYYFI